MLQKLNEHSSLNDWLGYIEKVSPENIKLGLDRVNKVKESLNLNSNFLVLIIL